MVSDFMEGNFQHLG